MKTTAVIKTKNHQISRISLTAQLISQAQATNPRIYAISFFHGWSPFCLHLYKKVGEKLNLAAFSFKSDWNEI